MASRHQFDDFLLDAANRRLTRAGQDLDLNARYFDALVLLVRNAGQLVAKDRFFDEVWGDVVVSDSALTQCIKDIRRRLGDDASNPRFIETVPRYGYRFVGTVSEVGSEVAITPAAARTEPTSAPSEAIPREPARSPLRLNLESAARTGLAGGAGGAAAGVFGGLLYGSLIASLAAAPEMGTASLLLVLVVIATVLGFMGALGVSLGIGLVRALAPWRARWSISGAALGGVFVGGVTKLLGVDAFMLLLGQAPVEMTGGIEGGVLGAGLAAGAALGNRIPGIPRRWCRPAGGAAGGALAGLLIAGSGGRLLLGSLEALTRSFAGSRIRLDAVGELLGEVGFGPTSQLVFGSLEGLLFGGLVVGSIVLVVGDESDA